MFDFTLKTYKKLINLLITNKYVFQSFQNYIKHPDNKAIILRHDIDKNPIKALKFAGIEQSMNISSSYYFRILPKSFNSVIIKQISELGHEIGYHYEDLTIAYKTLRKKNRQIENNRSHDLLYKKAIESFDKNLKKFREIYPVKTICMHGSPLSKLDNRDLWKIYNYKDFGIIGDPYFDLDFNDVLYLSDTGRRWDGSNVSVRDKVKTKYNYKLHSTFDIINTINILPDKIMLNVHPQRWNDKIIPWLYEYISQNIKNIVKKYFFVSSKYK